MINTTNQDWIIVTNPQTLKEVKIKKEILASEFSQRTVNESDISSRITETEKKFLSDMLVERTTININASNAAGSNSTGSVNLQESKVPEENPVIISSDETKVEVNNEDKKPAVGFNFDNLEGMSDIMDEDLSDPSSDESSDNEYSISYSKSLSGVPNATNQKLSTNDDRRKTLMLLEGIEEGVYDVSNIEQVISRKLSKTKSSIHQTSDFINKAQKSISLIPTDDMKNMLVELLHEKMNYEEKLRIARGAIMSRDEKITKMRSQKNVLPLSMSDSNVHLAFLFSSPLVRRNNSKMENIMQLDYLSEISDIVKVCENIGHEMKYRSSVATVSNLRSTITDCPIALHFSGHGIENTPENLGSDYFLTKNKGNILLLEDEQGMSDYFFEEDLKYMIEISQNTFEVVFVSSCYSQFAGEVFLNAGAKHVICIRAGERISDKASLRFSKVFYETLFVKNYNVCTAFRLAKEEIEHVINPTEANKFLLLIPPSSSYRSTESHNCCTLGDFAPGKLICTTPNPIFDDIPSNVEDFFGRQQEMYEIIHLLDNHRFVSILGPPGIGKTSISRNLSNYLRDRRKFNDGILYVGLRGCETAHMFLTRICVILKVSCQLGEYERFGLDQGSEVEDTNYRTFITHVLKDREVLIVLDNTEDPLECDNARFVAELNAILDRCRKVKFLITSRKSIDKLAHNAEKPYTLYPLSKEASLKLLIAKAPRPIGNQELQELLQCEIPKGSPIVQSLNINTSVGQGRSMNLLNHPFTALLGGHPQAISLAGPLLEYKSLKELFYAFCDSNVMDALEVSTSKNAGTSLRVSLELSINQMKNKMPEALKLFSFIGLLPGGVNDDELTQMWGNNKWVNLKDALVRASLLVYRIDNKGHFVYSMLPFMSIRAYELLESDEELKADYHNKCCKLFKDHCMNFFNSDKSLSTVQKFSELETNIWACIYRSINRKRDIVFTDPNEPANINANNQPPEDLSSSISEVLKNDEIHRGVDASRKTEFGTLEVPLSKTVKLDRISAPIEDIKRDVIDSLGDGNTPVYDEELLVEYYALNLISLEKFSDAMRVVSEYLQKSQISILGKANLYRILGSSLMLTEGENNALQAHESFDLSVKYYETLRITKGILLSKFLIVKNYLLHYKELQTVEKMTSGIKAPKWGKFVEATLKDVLDVLQVINKKAFSNDVDYLTKAEEFEEMLAHLNKGYDVSYKLVIDAEIDI